MSFKGCLNATTRAVPFPSPSSSSSFFSGAPLSRSFGSQLIFLILLRFEFGSFLKQASSSEDSKTAVILLSRNTTRPNSSELVKSPCRNRPATSSLWHRAFRSSARSSSNACSSLSESTLLSSMSELTFDSILSATDAQFKELISSPQSVSLQLCSEDKFDLSGTDTHLRQTSTSLATRRCSQPS